MQDVNMCLFMAVDDAARRLDDLAIAPTFEFGQLGAASWMVGELSDMGHHAPHEGSGCRWVIERDIICNRVQISERRLGPNYFSHRARRFLAWA